MTKQAWFCPACQHYHAPHVDTCPAGSVFGGNGIEKPGHFDPAPYRYWEAQPAPFDPCAGCKGACANAACPKRVRITSIASPYDPRASLSGTCQQIDGH
jgi:hypothetical protein